MNEQSAKQRDSGEGERRLQRDRNRIRGRCTRPHSLRSRITQSLTRNALLTSSNVVVVWRREQQPNATKRTSQRGKAFLLVARFGGH